MIGFRRVIAFAFSLSAIALAGSAPAAEPTPIPSQTPPLADPAIHVFPALGAGAERKVRVEWNRFNDCAGIEAILRDLAAAFPGLARLYSIGKSVEGRDLWCIEITAREKGDPARKPGMWIDGNTHGNEVQAGEVGLYTAWYLLHQYGRLEAVTRLLDEKVFYVVPTINPDGRDHWFHSPQTPHSSRTGVRPYDNDKDGLVDEDDVDDLDGDGAITMMRIKDPNGRYKPDPDYPEYLMVEVPPDQKGEYTLLGWEGIDNDGDGLVNEDPVGGYDPNRNWAYDWQPNHIQYGAQDYPFSLPESRAIADFILAHPNIAAMQSYHNNGGMILRSPGREGGVIRDEDERVMAHIAEQGKKMIPFYDSLVIWKDLYTTWGNEVDWFYGARGILCFTNELWTSENLYRTPGKNPTPQEEAWFMKRLLMNDGVVKWHPYDHPTYGRIEIGGTKKEWGRVPPSFLLEEECHRNMAFTLYHAEMAPRLKIADVSVDTLRQGLHRVWVTVENEGLIPTRAAQDVENGVSPPDTIRLIGSGVKVLSSGRVTDRFFKKAEPSRRRPDRVEFKAVPGLGAERAQFIVSGGGSVVVTTDSAKGGLDRKELTLP